jgi:MSHA biogenesis protein MshE
LTGHLVLSTLHTLDAAGTPMRLRDMGLAPYMIALGVRLVIAQRLVRTICEHCKRPYTPAPHESAWLRLEKQDVSEGPFFQGVGCGQCNNSGYKGRAGVYELMEMTPELVHLANKDDPSDFAAAAHKAFADFTLRRHALQLVNQGVTTIAEAMQASNQF